MHKVLLALVLFSAGAVLTTAQQPRVLHTFKKVQLTDQFWAEGAHVGDFNHDGKGDVVAGPFWYEGPDFKQRHEYSPATQTFQRKAKDGSEETIPGFEGGLGTKNAYSRNFLAFAHDFNKDGWDDILILGFPGEESAWHENPKKGSGHWPRHVILDVTDNESPTFTDLTGDGKPEIVCNSKGYFGYAEPDWTNPAQSWKFHAISPKGPWQRFTHGLGVGDVNGDGKLDVLDKDGWWEHPASLDGDPVWNRHLFSFAPGTGSSQMYAFDIDGDGDNDVATSLDAHGYGLAWYEQIKQDGKITFKQHVIMGKEPAANPYGVCFTQSHALDVADIDGDGLLDLITGKRFWAHGPSGDAEPNAPAVLYWFKLARHSDRSVEFVPHLVDNNSGIGTQVVATDLNGDKAVDLIVGNKKGAFAFLHETKQVSQAEFEKAQPKRLQPAPAKPSARGILPTTPEGNPLHLGFEDGTLKHWKAEGDAFQHQPVRGDTVKTRRPDMSSQHQGAYWIGTYEFHGDKAQGTLTSIPFKVTHPWASFLVAGGPYENTRVELVRADTNETIFKTSGYDSALFRESNNATESLRPIVVDLQAHIGREIFIRLVDRQDGHWGHINFDDFVFHQTKPAFNNAMPPAQKPIQALPSVDQVKFSGLNAEQAAAEASVPPGFKMHLFAGEPDVQQPIAFALDDRGRAWVAEAYNYPRRAADGEGKDRILIFEDTNGDGRFDKRSVFIERLNLVSGLEVGFGGVWVGAAPYLLFIPDRNADDKPDSEPVVVLDGWAWQDTHETLNTFTWGPDGWLYGCHGVFTHSNVGKPGAPDAERTRLNAGVWRYHPVHQTFELFAEGTSNPWGVDFDERGQCFIEACVIPHLFHMVQGGRFHRQAGQHFNPYTYDDIKTCGDHVHYAGNQGPHAANNRSDAAGGGHAHAGLMVYLGGSWPAEYRGKLFMNNIHGQRLNMDAVERRGSGFLGRHNPDFVHFNDRWSQIINLSYDQDGSVYLIDWYDQNQCHHNTIDGHDRSNGRVFKLVYGQARATPVDLQKKSDAELAALQLHANDWYVRHARRILQERAAAQGPLSAAHTALSAILKDNPDETRQLRALWALHVTGGLTEPLALEQLATQSEYVRAWTIQLLAEKKTLSPAALDRFTDLAKNDPSPVVRLYLASALQRLPIEQRWDALSALLSHSEDANDLNLPLMYWYAAEPAVGKDLRRAVTLLGQSKVPRVREFIARRMAAPDKVASSKP